MAGLATQALTSGGSSAAAWSFATAGVVLVALMFTASMVVARAQEGVVARARASAPAVKRWGGIVLMVVGSWFILLAVFAEAFSGLFPV